MNNQFDPFDPIIRLCLSGMNLEDNGKSDEAQIVFMQAWNDAEDDLGRFLSAYYIARLQQEKHTELDWLIKAMHHALNIDDVSVKSALPTLYSHIASCYEALSVLFDAKKYRDLACAKDLVPVDEGPFFHGTKAVLEVGDLLVPGGESNYKPGLKMNHIYFTANIKGAGLAAAMAKGEGTDTVYLVEPLGSFENDPNVTDKKFPGNLTRSYRSYEPLRILAKLNDWKTQTPEEILQWRKKLESNDGEIIN